MQLLHRRHGPRPPVPGTAADDTDMKRMGKIQKLNRVYGVITLVGYGAILGLTWPFSLITGVLSLTNGGPAGAVWVFVGVCCGMSTVVVSMAEMASIEPTTGGQYHWVSIFAPPKWRKLLSYVVGWMCALGWQSAVAGAANVGALAMQGLIVVANPLYVPKTWHLVMLSLAILCFVLFFNIFLARRLPGIVGVVCLLYLMSFIIVLAVLLGMGERSSAKEVFTVFQDNAGWGSIGTACFVGVSGPVITIIGSDSAAHLAEELKDASRQLPKAMILTAIMNYILGFIMLVAFVYVVGDVKEVLASPTGQPYIQVIWNATQSRGPTIVLVALIIFFILFAVTNANTTASRQIWAFARDGGLPFSGWINYVSPYMHIPINAVCLTWFIDCCLCLIPLGSTAAFLNIQTISQGGLLTSYILCICCRLYHRNAIGVYGTLEKRPPFGLNKTVGNVVNTAAILFLCVFLTSAMFPGAPHPTVESMNWSSMALGTTVCIALIAYIWLHKKYLGPDIERPSDTDGGEFVRMDMESKVFDGKN